MSPLAAFVRTHVAPHADAWEGERRVPWAAARELFRAGLLPLRTAADPDGVVARLELAALLGGTGSLGTAVTLLHAGTPLRLLARSASPELRTAVLQPALAGAACGAAALGGAACTVTAAGGMLTLDGALACAPGAGGADWLMVPASIACVPNAWVVVPLRAPGVAVERRATVGLHTAGLGEVRFTGCVLPASHLLAVEPGTVADELADERLVLCGALLAALGRVLRGALAWLGTRPHAAGGMLGEQPVVRHRLADLLAGYEVAAALFRSRADARTAGEAPAHGPAASLMLACTEMARRAAEECMQLQGAAGYMAAHPAARAYRDVLALDLWPAADPDALEREAADDLFAAASSSPLPLPAPVLAGGAP